jgi:hypothetical protein
MRWTQAAQKTDALLADGEVVWSRHPDADVKLATMLRIAPATETKSPVSEESAKETVKTIARGMPVVFGVPVVTMLVCFLHLRTRLWVHRAPGIPCAL